MIENLIWLKTQKPIFYITKHKNQRKGKKNYRVLANWISASRAFRESLNDFRISPIFLFHQTISKEEKEHKQLSQTTTHSSRPLKKTNCQGNKRNENHTKSKSLENEKKNKIKIERERREEGY